MAMTKCPDCGREVSTDATSCPQCGKPLKAAQIVITKQATPWYVVGCAIAIGIVALFSLLLMFGSDIFGH